MSTIPVYRFFTDLQHQGKRNYLGLYIEDLKKMFFHIPRIEYKDCIILQAHWFIKFNEPMLKGINVNNIESMTKELENFRMKFKLPKLVLLCQGDNELLIDFDTDATFMRMKEDHMLNGQLKPAYNIQISTSNQFIVNYTIHPNPTDTTTLKTHLEQHESSFGKVPKTLTADARYESEENYTLLEGKQIEAYVKYNMFDRGQNYTYYKKHPLFLIAYSPRAMIGYTSYIYTVKFSFPQTQ